jgi:uncharacterized OsmC-like protein
MPALDSYLERKSAVLQQRQEDFRREPAKGVVRIQASSWVAGNSGARPVRLGEMLWITDSAPALAGNALGPTAPEMLLGALASCLVHTYLIAAALHGVALDQVEVRAQGALDMGPVVGLPADDLPRLAKITYQADVSTPAGAEAVERLHAEVERLCPVLNTLRFPVAVARTGG